MDVSDVLRDRMQEPAGLQRMVIASVAVHAVCAAALFLAPGKWLSQQEEAPRTVMTISLGGGGGPQSGGATALGGRPVQVQTPEDAKREAVRPPAAKTPEMTISKTAAKPSKVVPGPAVTQAPDEARGRTPTKGAETSAGSAVAETGVRGQGFGLSSGGSEGSGSTLDVADFCCPEYIQTMLQRIRSIWNQDQKVAGECIIKFTIQRDGTITDHEVERTSGDLILDRAARSAVVSTRKLPPLPTQFPNPTLTVHLNFRYQR